MTGTAVPLVTDRQTAITPKQGPSGPAPSALNAANCAPCTTKTGTSARPRPLALGGGNMAVVAPRDKDRVTSRNHPLRSRTNLTRDQRWIGERVRRRYLNRGDA
jgi:hypothetical protein